LQVHDWQVIVNEHGPLVWQTAYRLLGNDADAADCFQETFLAAFEIAGAQPVRNLCGLLVRLATTRAIDRLRQHSRRARHNGSGLVHQSDGDAGDPCTIAQQHELGAQLRRAIARLPAPEGKAFCMRYLSGLSYREIARELDISINAAGVLLHRVKCKLRNTLQATQVSKERVSNER
jgi:RNA polymerase sigma-70 factor (ECF subfamily)